tara:strand:+ start:179 stop:487 length:309 start_codon:yes stop_codon:yes gene_type:complete
MILPHTASLNGGIISTILAETPEISSRINRRMLPENGVTFLTPQFIPLILSRLSVKVRLCHGIDNGVSGTTHGEISLAGRATSWYSMPLADSFSQDPLSMSE